MEQWTEEESKLLKELEEINARILTREGRSPQPIPTFNLFDQDAPQQKNSDQDAAQEISQAQANQEEPNELKKQLADTQQELDAKKYQYDGLMKQLKKNRKKMCVY
jgi:hypothetical protein